VLGVLGVLGGLEGELSRLGRLGGLGRLEGMLGRLEGMLGGLEGALVGLGGALVGLEGAVGGFEGVLSRLSGLGGLGGGLVGLECALVGIEGALGGLSSGLGGLSSGLVGLEGVLGDLGWLGRGLGSGLGFGFRLGHHEGRRRQEVEHLAAVRRDVRSAIPFRAIRPVATALNDLLARLNHDYAAALPEQTELDARIRNYELAFRMQAEAPAAVDLAQETEETKSLYGLDEKPTAAFGRTCLLARRLVERGVRFVQLYHGAGNKWDAHSGIEKNHADLCSQMDKPVAGLLADLRRRGLLDSTLVIWGGEFGRTPMSEQGNGRDHNPTGFTMWMAGGGVRGGTVHGTTDEIGLHAVENRLHVHDLHSTILYLMGLDHKKLVYFHAGRPERIDANEGHVYKAIAS
jgi:hypothetical protein